MSVPYGSDPWLDARLRNVPLPPGMLARLTGLATDDDRDFLPPSDGLGPRVAGPKLFEPVDVVACSSRVTDEQMDQLLVDVELPRGLYNRLKRLSHEPRRRISVLQLALAAGILLAASVGYLIHSTFRPHDPRGRLATSNPTFASPKGEVRRGRPDEAPAGSPSPQESIVIDEPKLEADDFDPAAEERSWDFVDVNSQLDLPDPFASPAKAKIRPSKEWLFASDRAISLPELEIVDTRDVPQGMAPPLARGYDLRFFAKYGEHPFVNPSAHKDLSSVRIPLVTSTASYEYAWQALVSDKLPAADKVRVEEFLAAVDYGFAPAAPGSLALRTAAGPSPFAPDPGIKLLQVAVQTGGLVTEERVGRSVSFVIDTSMRREGRMMLVRRALADLANHLEAQDRFSLIATSDPSKLIVDALGQDQLPRIISAIESLEPQRVNNVGAGLEAAYLAALERTTEGGGVRRVVLVTDGLADQSDEAIDRLEKLVTDGHAKGVSLDLVYVGPFNVEQDKRVLERIASAGGGNLSESKEAHSIQFAFLESLTERSRIIARNTSLRVMFNSQAVAAYRVVGHETHSLTGIAAAPSVIEMHAGEAATALIELRLNSLGGDQVATVEMTWVDAASGEQRSARQWISRLQFAKSFAESPLSLQMAAIVGHTAEVLRRSHFANDKTLRPVLKLASAASPLVTDRPQMRIFLAFVEKAELVRASASKRP